MSEASKTLREWMDYGEIGAVVYHSCDIVLEVNVVWTGDPGETREVVLARLPEELLHEENHERAREYVRPFVEAVKRRDPRALREVCRALYVLRDIRACVGQPGFSKRWQVPESFYDPNEHDEVSKMRQNEVLAAGPRCVVPDCNNPATVPSGEPTYCLRCFDDYVEPVEKKEEAEALREVEHVHHPKHYGGDTDYEAIKVMEAWHGPDAVRIFCQLNAEKYLCRAGTKEGQPLSRDLDKAAWYAARAADMARKVELLERIG